MGKDSAIEWTDHTFSPWWGCEKVSPACKNCYAATNAARWRPDTPLWGPGSIRQIASERAWGEPLRWNRAAEKAGVRAKVFCASMSDVFEDLPELQEPRERLAKLIARTRSLDWLLLTKRPENIVRLAREALMINSAGSLDGNVWIGTTVEDQERAQQRIPHLLLVPAKVRFLSCEPLLGPVDLLSVTTDPPGSGFALTDGFGRFDGEGPPGIHWVIAGGESGAGARPTHPAWVRALRDQVVRAGVAFHFKQHGAWAPACAVYGDPDPSAGLDEFDPAFVRAVAPDGSVLEEEDGQPPPGSWWMARIGKGNSGRELDGRTWDQFPKGATCTSAS